jgi:transcriptional regulator GlxA family with amidase domain
MMRLNKNVIRAILLVMLPTIAMNMPASNAEGPPSVKPKPRNVAIVIHDGVELLDFAGPGQVFAVSKDEHGPLFNVYTVSSSKTPITSQGFLTVTPQYSTENCPEPDIIVIPGGDTMRLIEDEAFMKWLAHSSQSVEIMMSVCTGALVPAKLHMLEGQQATTYHSAIEHLREVAPTTVVHENVRFVDNGKIITTAGVSAGIDGALHVVARLHGDEIAQKTAAYMEYEHWKPNMGLVVKP